MPTLNKTTKHENTEKSDKTTRKAKLCIDSLTSIGVMRTLSLVREIMCIDRLASKLMS